MTDVRRPRQAQLTGDFAKTSAGVRVRAKGHVDERGAPTELTVDMHPEDEGVPHSQSILDFDARWMVPSFEGLARIGPIAKGRGELHAMGRIKLTEQVIDAKLVAELEGLAKAHGELATVELLELEAGIRHAAFWALLIVLGALGAWLGVNGAVVALCWQHPWQAAIGLVLANAAMTILGVTQLSRVARRSYFACSKREVLRGVRLLVRASP